MLASAARIAFGLFFAGSAILKLIATPTMTGMLAGAGFVHPLPLVYIAAAAQAAAGLALIAGRLVAPAAIGLIFYVAIVNFYLHPFWTMTGEAASLQFQLFTKNLGLMAGLMAVAGSARKSGRAPEEGQNA